jgi:hypothetical protein
VLDESMATMALPVYDTLWALNEFACTTEEPDCYFAVLRGFLAQVGGGNAAGVSLEPTVTATAG